MSGADLLAQQDVTGVGAEVLIDASRSERHHDETHETKTTGFTLGVRSPLLEAAQKVQQQTSAGEPEPGWTGGSAACGSRRPGNLVGAGQDAAALAAGKKPEIGVELGWGTSSSRETLREDGTQHTGSTIRAGGTAAFVATGNGQPGSGQRDDRRLRRDGGATCCCRRRTR